MPSRGWCVEPVERSSASSSSDRPIVPPAPAEFSMQSQVSPSQRSRICSSAGHGAVEPGLEAGAEMRADVEDDRVGFDRRGRVDVWPSVSTDLS